MYLAAINTTANKRMSANEYFMTVCLKNYYYYYYYAFLHSLIPDNFPHINELTITRNKNTPNAIHTFLGINFNISIVIEI